MNRYLALVQERHDLVAESRTLDVATDEGRARFGEIESRIAAIDEQLLAEEKRREWERTAPAVQPPQPQVSDDLRREAFLAYVRHGTGAFRMRQEYQAALVSGQDNLGGFTVPEDFHRELIRDLAGRAVIRSRARIIQTSSDAAVFPALASGTDPYGSDLNTDSWKSEADLVSSVTSRTQQNKPTFERLRVPVHYWSPDLIVLSQGLLQDSAVDLDAELRRLIAETKALDEDKAFVKGSGVGQPLGLLQDVMDGKIAVVNSGAASALTYNGLVNLFTALPMQYRANAVWLMNSNTLGAVAKLADSQSRPIFPVNDLPASLFGRPVLIDEFMPDVAANDFPILFGDLSYYGIAERAGLSFIRLDELFAPSVALLVYGRVGGQALRFGAFRAQKVAA